MEDANEMVTLDEIFATAEMMESRAVEYYERAAELHPGLTETEVLKDLAAMEQGHLAIVRRMRAAAREAGTPPKGPIAGGGLVQSAVAASLAVEGSRRETEALTGEETLEEIIARAVELEHASVRLYEDLRLALPPDADRDALERLIAEERKHVDTLQDHLVDSR